MKEKNTASMKTNYREVLKTEYVNIPLDENFYKN